MAGVRADWLDCEALRVDNVGGIGTGAPELDTGVAGMHGAYTGVPDLDIEVAGVHGIDTGMGGEFDTEVGEVPVVAWLDTGVTDVAGLDSGVTVLDSGVAVLDPGVAGLDPGVAGLDPVVAGLDSVVAGAAGWGHN